MLNLMLLIISVLVCSPNQPHLASVVPSSGKNSLTPAVQCTSHMCPIRIHWHVKLNYKEYWRVKVTITNFNYNMNYSQWNLVVQHPNFDNLTQIFSFNSKPLTPYGDISKLVLPLWLLLYYQNPMSCTEWGVRVPFSTTPLPPFAPPFFGQNQERGIMV